MKKLLRYICAFLLCLCLTASSAPLTQEYTGLGFLLPEKPSPTQGVVASLPTPTPVAPTSPHYYTSGDVLLYLQKQGYPLQVTFPPSLNFGSLYPQDYIGFADTHDTSYAFVIVVYATYQDAYSGYLYLSHTTNDVFVYYNRCVVGAG